MYIKVIVQAGMRKESFEQVGEGRFALSVREKAEANRANRRVIEMIAAHYDVPTGAVRIVNGHHSPSKLLALDDRAYDA